MKQPIAATKKNNVLGLFKDFVKLLRLKEWIKNLFIFIPVFFAGEIFQSNKFVELAIGFLAFGLVASSIYILNDYRDIESDKLHPVKCKRPLAAGIFSPATAIAVLIACAATGLAIAYSLHMVFFFILLAYFMLNLGYCFGLKNISILDINFIAIGFVLRIKGGGVIAGVGISQWLTIMVYLLALFLALTKRRDDLYLKQASGVDMRKSIKGYSLEMINILLAVVSAIMIMAYIMYATSPATIAKMGTHRLYYTAVFVVAGLFRYLQITYINRSSESPTKMLYKDLFIQGVIVLWIISFYIILYLPNIKVF
ncbi:decaprenyl-phosphate phosphoribosyltransferase [Foetidibacter luteolus]|uniref:decaprenyl-phosphate phosphoribosyltransferase n=1 Tax=Foetidibacter luteolus TaxID=2608880 RepID=UPI00129AD6F1|nr:decaprenyl-phosphate phosphoribosyltransferase [Foetidibacter luteolus]